MNQSASKNDFKNPLGPNGTVITLVSRKAGREQNPLHSESFMHLFGNLAKMVHVGSHFGAHWILKGGSQIENVWNKSKAT